MEQIGKIAEFDPNQLKWSEWLEKFSFFCDANDIQDNNRRRATLYTSVGDQTYSKIKSLVFPAAPIDIEYNELLKKCNEHFCEPPVNELLARIKFNERYQRTNETIQDFVQGLQSLAQDCGFENEQLPIDIMLRDQFVTGLKDGKLQKYLCTYHEESKTSENTVGLTFNKAVEIIHRMESLSDEAKRKTLKNDKSLTFQSTSTRCNKINHSPNSSLLKNNICKNCFTTGHTERFCDFTRNAKSTKPVHNDSKSKTKRNIDIQNINVGTSVRVRRSGKWMNGTVIETINGDMFMMKQDRTGFKFKIRTDQIMKLRSTKTQNQTDTKLDNSEETPNNSHSNVQETHSEATQNHQEPTIISNHGSQLTMKTEPIEIDSEPTQDLLINNQESTSLEASESNQIRRSKRKHPENTGHEHEGNSIISENNTNNTDQIDINPPAKKQNVNNPELTNNESNKAIINPFSIDCSKIKTEPSDTYEELSHNIENDNPEKSESLIQENNCRTTRLKRKGVRKDINHHKQVHVGTNVQAQVVPKVEKEANESEVISEPTTSGRTTTINAISPELSAANGTTNSISGPTDVLSKTSEDSPAPNQQSPIKASGPVQKVQVSRGPDGRMQVRGLRPGQQLVRMPDGRLHVLKKGQGKIKPKTTITSPTMPSTPAPGSMEASLLVGKPPGTIVMCVTAQVSQGPQGPRIVLQGLQGTDFTSSQLATIHQQVKQQLLKTLTTSGQNGVLGPTKIYLAVQPAAHTEINNKSQDTATSMKFRAVFNNINSTNQMNGTYQAASSIRSSRASSITDSTNQMNETSEATNSVKSRKASSSVDSINEMIETEKGDNFTDPSRSVNNADFKEMDEASKVTNSINSTNASSVTDSANQMNETQEAAILTKPSKATTLTKTRRSSGNTIESRPRIKYHRACKRH